MTAQLEKNITSSFFLSLSRVFSIPRRKMDKANPSELCVNESECFRADIVFISEVAPTKHFPS